MTKAQQIRNRRLEKMQSDITVQAKKVFDWMLDLIDANTERGFFGPMEVCLFDDQYTIKTTSLSGKKDTEYELCDFLLHHDRLAFFSTLKKIVEQEDGFKANLQPDAIFWDSKCIMFEIVIE